ncbi:MAG TPA: hypothetical protein DDY18_07405 [Flavobacterium sp.]|jgi:hypothetical protein|nr:hypothetical protein [Flavobacterium sp.]
MVVVLLLGENDEYLGYKEFKYSHQAELFIGQLHNLMLANIEKTLPLKERLQLAPEYFPFAGRLQNVELIQLSKTEGENNERSG